MFEWFKGKKAGADFSSIDSKEKAEALFKNGQLQKILLLPSSSVVRMLRQM
jgi:hypothetical protein